MNLLKWGFVIGCFIGLTAACSNEQLTAYEYEGSSAFWEAEMMVEELPAAEPISEQVELTLTYTDNYQRIEAVEVVADSRWEHQYASTTEIEELDSSEIQMSFDSGGQYGFVMMYDAGYALDVEVKWEEEGETFQENLTLEPVDSYNNTGLLKNFYHEKGEIL